MATDPEKWERNDIQFPRLLSEIWAVGLTPGQMRDLAESMDLDAADIEELFERAEEIFEGLKEHLEAPLPNCYICGRDDVAGT